jgi:hypothetical protein
VVLFKVLFWYSDGIQSLPPHQHATYNFACREYTEYDIYIPLNARGPFENVVDCRQCAAVIQREAVTVMPSCSGGGNVVVV